MKEQKGAKSAAFLRFYLQIWMNNGKSLKKGEREKKESKWKSWNRSQKEELRERLLLPGEIKKKRKKYGQIRRKLKYHENKKSAWGKETYIQSQETETEKKIDNKDSSTDKIKEQWRSFTRKGENACRQLRRRFRRHLLLLLHFRLLRQLLPLFSPFFGRPSLTSSSLRSSSFPSSSPTRLPSK